MSRWAQRRRAGGGPSTQAAIEILEVRIGGNTDELEVEFSANITAASFNLTDFFTNPSSQVPTTIVQLDPNEIRLTFPLDLDLELSLTYQGSVPGITTPQTVPIT